MKLAVFGCSWTYGVTVEWSKKTTSLKYKNNIPQDDFVNWTRELGKLCPNFEIYNYAIPGTSIEFSLGMLERYLKNPHCDFIIFQLTRPYRYTYWSQDFDETLHFKKYEPNVSQFDYSILDYVTIIDHHNDNNKIWNVLNKPDIENQYIKKYFTNTSNEMFENNYKAITSYIKDKVDICFSHESNGLTNSVQDTLGDKMFENYWMDEGKHFGIIGAQWQAKWVLDQINTCRGCENE
tara:strand:+ start:1463 stop:2170 length:708 start_codon:yes stop_codon:yes gene_type:complete